MYSDDFPEVDKAALIADYVKEIQRAVDYMADCKRIKEELEARIAALLEHTNDGQKTYYEAGYKLEIKASVNYSLDKEEYEALKEFIPVEFDPVRKSKKEVITYNLDKSVIRNIHTYAEENLKKMLFEKGDKKKALIEEKPRSLTINIGVA